MPIIKVEQDDMFDCNEVVDTFIVVPSETIAALLGAGSPDALAIACYLADKPASWIVRRTDILKQLSMGRIRYDRARAILERAGMWKNERERKQGAGTFSAGVVTFSVALGSVGRNLLEAPQPNESSHGAGNQTTGELVGITSGLKTHRLVNPHCGESDHIDINILLKHKHTSKHGAVAPCESEGSDLNSDKHLTNEGTPSMNNAESKDSNQVAEPVTKTYAQGDYIRECMTRGLEPDLGELEHMNRQGWIVNGEAVHLFTFLDDRKQGQEYAAEQVATHLSETSDPDYSPSAGYEYGGGK